MPTVSPPTPREPAASVAGEIAQLGRYRILEEVGRGSCGTVYRASDTVIERDVALKTVRRPGPTASASDHESYARFIRESRAAGKLAHPNVVAVYDIGEDDASGLSFIAMEFVAGDSLDRLLARELAPDFAQVRSIGMQVAEALAAAHAAGVVHRDIKPANLILRPDGVVKVADFGIAKIESAETTQHGSLIGSPSYMSPEQVRATSIDHRSDLFSLGTVLYELSTLRQPFAGETVIAVIQKVAKGKVDRALLVDRAVPRDIAEVILRALSRSRDDRFQSATEMSAALVAADLAIPFAAPEDSAATMLIAPEDSAATIRIAPEDSPADVAEAASAGSDEPAAPAENEPSRPAQRSWARPGIALAAATGIVAILGLAAWRLRDVPPEAAAVVVDEALPSPVAAAGIAAESTEPERTPTPAPTVAAQVATPRPARKRSRRPRRTPPPVAAVSPAPTPEPPPEPPPRPLPYAAAATHDHRLGSCAGTLRISAAGIAYDASEHDKDDREWSFDEIGELRTSEGELTLVARERDKGSLGLRARRYRFRLAGGALPAAVAEALEQRLDR